MGQQHCLHSEKSQLQNGLVQVKEDGWTGFFERWQGCSKGNPEEQLCQSEVIWDKMCRKNSDQIHV